MAITHTISTGGTKRADELAFDGVHHLILIANDQDTPPFVSFISTTTYTVVQKINYDGNGSNPQSTGGIEQCRDPLDESSKALAACWEEIAERVGMTSITVQTTSIGQKIVSALKGELEVVSEEVT